jgi:hypothetical protein
VHGSRCTHPDPEGVTQTQTSICAAAARARPIGACLQPWPVGLAACACLATERYSSSRLLTSAARGRLPWAVACPPVGDAGKRGRTGSRKWTVGCHSAANAIMRSFNYLRICYHCRLFSSLITCASITDAVYFLRDYAIGKSREGFE